MYAFMSLEIFIHAFTATFAMLCVVGPICMTVINTTIAYGFSVGISAGAGVAVADTVYIVVASLAIVALEGILRSKIITAIGLCGGIFLYYLVYKFWNTKPVSKSEKVSGNRLKSFMTLFCLTLTGPTTILTYQLPRNWKFQCNISNIRWYMWDILILLHTRLSSIDDKKKSK